MPVDRPASDLVVPEATVLEACGDPELPSFGVVEQVRETDPIPEDDIARVAAVAVGELRLDAVPDGGEVAVGAGSRGIANLPELVGGVVDGLRERGYEPFVFPAMGSHGGATAEGQRDKLATLGVTEDSVDCEIRATMDVERVGETPERGVPLYVDASAAGADGIVPVNRVKPHTDFDGTVESGLSKMLVIGMGKQRGAKTAHDWAVDWSFRNMIPEITEQLLAELPVAGGVAVVENERDDTALIEGVPPGDFLDREAELLEIATGRMPTLPFDELDGLIVDALGKDVSGQGMDTNVIGRRPFAPQEPEPDSPELTRIYLRGLTAATKGNAMGVGSADFLGPEVLEGIDASKSLINAITASTVRGVRLPPIVESDRAGLAAVVSTVGVVGPGEVRALWVADTMHLERMYASAALVERAREREDLRVIDDPEPLSFEAGRLAAVPPGDL
jgi:hypothetical protein